MSDDSGTAVIRLDDVRRERAATPGRELAIAIRQARRCRTLIVSETLDDATRTVHSRRFRPIDRKLAREVRDALAVGCDAAELHAALTAYVDALVPMTHRGRIAA